MYFALLIHNCFQGLELIIIIIKYSYHALINALIAPMNAHVNLSTISDTRRAHSYRNNLHKILHKTHTHTAMNSSKYDTDLYAHVRAHTHTDTHTHTLTMTEAEAGYDTSGVEIL